MLWGQGLGAELGHLVHRYERTDVFHVHLFNLLVFVAGAETVEEVDEGHAAFESGQVGNG